MTRSPAPDDQTTTLAFGLLGTNLFGPQSQWSSLLAQREHLFHEVKRGRKYLEQLRKDLAECGALVEGWPAKEAAEGSGCMPGLALQASANDVMEQFLLKWLERLEERLKVISQEIEAVEAQGGAEPLDPEASMFELLRAAG